MLVCTAAQMREIDRVTIEDYGVPGVVLMECAGRGVVKVINGLREVEKLRMVVLCGGGNNGGDGFVVARHLISQGARVKVLLVAERSRIRGDALINLAILERMQADIQEVGLGDDLERANNELTHAEIIVDALLGTGLNSEVRGIYRAVIERVNRCTGLKIAVDIPSGLNADNGQVMGVAFDADQTVTFGYPKLGLVTHPGVNRVGQLHVVDIGILRSVEATEAFVAEVLEDEKVRRWLLHRPPWGHKGTYGQLLVIAGSAGKSGAAILCGEAALKSGAGLTTIASPPAVMQALECKTREVMLAPLLPDGQTEIDASDEVFAHLHRLLQGKSALAIGPGIPRGPGMQSFICRLVEEAPIPLVIDADGLNELAPNLHCLSKAAVPILLTPHPGEMATLTGKSVNEIQTDRLNAAVDFAQQHNVYLALKGLRTVVVGPDGKAYLNPTGNSGMGSGGTGDVLTGLVGGLLAQRHEPLDALCLGVFIHGRAGDIAAEIYGQRALIASNLMDKVADVLKGWE